MHLPLEQHNIAQVKIQYPAKQREATTDHDDDRAEQTGAGPHRPWNQSNYYSCTPSFVLVTKNPDGGKEKSYQRSVGGIQNFLI